MQYEKYMHRCLELAAKARGHTMPNPMVGAVIVHDGKIIGEGYHRQYGEAHAEPVAIASVQNQELLENSTLYVNLEPCSHFGKTPPCAKLIIEKKIPRVVVGGLDPYPKVSGRGVKMLQDAGIEVVVGVLEKECEALNKRFLIFHRFHRPYIILKWAQSSDRYMDIFREYGDGKQAVCFSSESTRMLVHKFRAEEGAIMVGTRTALLDNPSLTVRHWCGNHPLRIFIDKNLVVPETHHLLSDGKAQTLVFTEKMKKNTSFVEYYRLDFSRDILPQILEVLYDKKIQSLIVEGGAYLLNEFMQSNIWDEMYLETVNVQLKEGVKSPVVTEFPDHIYNCEKSILSSYTNRKLPKIL